MSTELIPTLETAIARRLAAWSSDARGAYAAATERALRVDSRVFSEWCAAAALAALPAAPATVGRFLREQSNAGLAVATVRRRAASIATLHRAAGVANPCAAEPVRLALRAIARERGTDQHQAAPLSARDAQRIADRVLGDDTRARDVRDVALMLVGRDLLARASELVSLTVDAVTFDIDGRATCAVRRRKTSTAAQVCLLGPDATAALKRWLDGARITSGAVFQSITKSGRATGTPLSARDVSRILKVLAGRVRLDAARISGHSLRVGMACDLVAANIDGAAIQQAAGWSTPRMLARYTGKLAAKRGAIARFYRSG